MIIQMQGTSLLVNPTIDSTFADGSTGRGYTTLNNVGYYEFRQVVAVSITSVIPNIYRTLDLDRALIWCTLMTTPYLQAFKLS
jgi:hypothetical protein